MIDCLLIIGVGLIGGSVAQAARTHGLCQHIIGIDPDEDNLQCARTLGIIDTGIHDIQALVQTPDLVVIATPVGDAANILDQLQPHWSDSCVYTDVGSTKLSLLEAARQVFGSIPGNLVPGHPIAGAETSGVAAARADLYQNKRVILTPVTTTYPEALNTVATFWQAMGAHTVTMDAEHHDAVLAATSHLPHVIAYALVNMLGHQDEQSEIFQYAAGGFKDFTRIASSDPTMWRDICLANPQALVPLIRQFCVELDDLATYIEHNDSKQLMQVFSSARQARQRFLDQYEQPTHSNP